MADITNQGMENKSQHEEKPTPRQLEVLFRYLSGHREMILDELTPMFTVPVRNWLWEDVAFYLNVDDFGPKRNGLLWRKIWAQLKFDVKNAVEEQHYLAINGEPNIAALSPVYAKVAALVRNVTISVLRPTVDPQVPVMRESVSSASPPLPSAPESHSSTGFNRSSTEVNIDAITAALKSELKDLATKLIVPPQEGHDTDNFSDKQHLCKDKSVEMELLKAQKRIADGIVDLTDVLEQTNELSEQRLLIIRERNKIAQERIDIEKYRNQLLSESTFTGTYDCW